MNKFKPIEVRPTNGGRLMTAVSKDSVGLNNYTIKRDFRRDLDREVRAEGYDKFRPNTLPNALATQHLPAGVTGHAIELEITARRSNGSTALIVGTKSTIWKFSGSDNGNFVEDGFVDETYFEDVNIGAWVQIGSGFSLDGRRWEAELLGDYLILNNTVDLPVTYRLQDAKVLPIYELREQGVASVGTIAVHDGVLVCADISLLDDATLSSIMSLVPLTGTAAQTGIASGGSVRAKLNSGVDGVAGNRITADSPIFQNADVGKKIRLQNGATRTITALIGAAPTATVTVDGVADTAEPFQPFYWPAAGTTDFTVIASIPVFGGSSVGLKLVWDSGYIREVVSINSTTSVVVDQDGPVPSGPFRIENAAAYGAFTAHGKTDRFQYRLFWAMPDLPRRFGATIPASIAAQSNYLTFPYPAKSIEPGMTISIPGANVNGGTLTATVVYVSNAHNLVAIDTPAITSVTNVLIEASDAAASIVAFEDLVDDGSAIIKMLTLRQVLVIYRETSIFLGVLTGDTSTPFTFDRPIRTENSLFHKNTLIAITPVQGGVPFHLFAGRSSFYKFDLITKSPAEVMELHLAKDVFFKDASGPRYLLGKEWIDYTQLGNTPPLTFGVNGDAFQAYLVRDDDGSEHVDRAFAIGTREWPYPPTVSIRTIIAQRDDMTFAAENPLTREVFFFFPGSGADMGLRYNYRDGTVSTTSMATTAAAMIRRPLNPSEQSQRLEEWFLLGTADGTLFRYGLVQADEVNSGSVKATKAFSTVTANASIFEPFHVGRSIKFSGGQLFAITAWISELEVTVVAAGTSDDVTVAQSFTIIPAIYHRDGQGYDSVLASGIDAFGTSYKEKQMDAYALILGSNTAKNSLIQVSIVGGVNPSESHVLGTKTITLPKTQNLVPVAFLENYFGDQITVSGINNPVEVAARILSIAGVDSASFVRRPQ